MPTSLVAGSISGLYPNLLKLLMGEGKLVNPRGQRTKEGLAVTVHVTDLTQNILVHPVRNLNYRFMVAEWLWMMAGRDDVATLAKYNREMLKFSDNDKILAGAYGPRLRSQPHLKYEHLDYFVDSYDDQLTWCVDILKKDPDSRQAVATIWSPCPPPSKDVPCTVAAQFLLRGNKLHAIFTMRSSDAWLGLPYDFFNFSMIANCLAGELKAEPGSLTMQLGSSHLYEQHWPLATELISRWQEAETMRSPALPCLPAISAFNTMLDVNVSPLSTEPWYRYQNAIRKDSSLACLEVLRHAA